MDKLTAFNKLWAAEGNAARAATLLSYAFVIQKFGWDALKINANKKQGVQNALARSEIVSDLIEFSPAEIVPEGAAAKRITPKQIKSLRREIEDEFGTLAVNMRGRQYKKTEWRNRRNVVEPNTDDE